MTEAVAPPLAVEFAGERSEVPADRDFSIGRDADLVIDDNPYLHRRFLTLRFEGGLWWIANTGDRIAATLTEASGHVHATLGPGARLPIVFDRLHVLFSAGSTTYDLTVHSEGRFEVTPAPAPVVGDETIGDVPLTPSQRLLLVALAENVLRQTERGRGDIPSSTDAAVRLGWTLTAFTRKLDNVCAKFEREGVSGLRGAGGKHAVNRRQRLVEHAVATRLVTRDDLALLDALPAAR